MKKADITKATSTHDKCAIFEVQRGDSGMKRYARLLTQEEKQQQNLTGRVVYCSSSAPKIAIVYVHAIGNGGETSGAPCEYTDFVVTGFTDAMRDFVPLARIKRCINETQSFVDFFNAEVTAKKDAAKRAKEAAKRREQVAENHKNRIKDLNARLIEFGYNGNSVSEARSYYGMNHEVTISIDTLTELVRLAEQAHLTEKVGA